jgi:methylated-DNA-[protein]-cysteine S-methyltransferase
MKRTNPKTLSFNGLRTAFAQQVYAIVARIPKGKVMTYAEVAERAGRPNASRAVGTIMSKNRDLRVPCHRVIRSDGGMGGYAFGGANKKRDMLRREGVSL